MLPGARATRDGPRDSQSGPAEAELHCAVGNEPARRFDVRMGWLHSRKIMEQVAGERGPKTRQPHLEKKCRRRYLRRQNAGPGESRKISSWTFALLLASS